MFDHLVCLLDVCLRLSVEFADVPDGVLELLHVVLVQKPEARRFIQDEEGDEEDKHSRDYHEPQIVFPLLYVVIDD